MTEPEESAPLAATPRPQAAIAAPELAALLAGRLCHDVISPASAIVSGLDLLADPTAADMQADAMSLIAGSARKLVAQVAFARVAFGASSAAETFDPRELEKLTRAVFAHVRADLDWAVTLTGVGKAAARALLNLAQLAGGALPTAGWRGLRRRRWAERSTWPPRRRARACACGRRSSPALRARR